MRLIEKIMVLSIILTAGVLPSFAKLEGSISKGHFYDVEKTIMTDVIPNQTLKTGKYWEKNLLHFNKYRPVFMLSNKELYDLMPRENVSVVQRIIAPSVYNISLKTASIKKVSLTSSQPTNLLTPVKVKPSESQAKIYEQAKNPDIEPEKKIDAAVSLMESKNPSDYSLAIDLLDDVIKKEPYNAYAFYLKGELYSKQKDSEKAMKNYVEALKINPTSKQCCLGIAKILEPTNKCLAQKYYDRAK